MTKMFNKVFKNTDSSSARANTNPDQSRGPESANPSTKRVYMPRTTKSDMPMTNLYEISINDSTPYRKRSMFDIKIVFLMMLVSSMTVNMLFVAYLMLHSNQVSIPVSLFSNSDIAPKNDYIIGYVNSTYSFATNAVFSNDICGPRRKFSIDTGNKSVLVGIIGEGIGYSKDYIINKSLTFNVVRANSKTNEVMKIVGNLQTSPCCTGLISWAKFYDLNAYSECSSYSIIDWHNSHMSMFKHPMDVFYLDYDIANLHTNKDFLNSQYINFTNLAIDTLANITSNSLVVLATGYPHPVSSFNCEESVYSNVYGMLIFSAYDNIKCGAVLASVNVYPVIGS